MFLSFDLFSLPILSRPEIEVDIVSQLEDVFNSEGVTLDEVLACSMHCLFENLQNASLGVMMPDVVAVSVCEHAHDIV